MGAAGFDIERTYFHLEDGPRAKPVPVGDDFWATIDTRTDLQGGRLVTVSHFRSQRDWDHWERHPAGDELVYLLTGALDIVLQEPDGERIVELREQTAAVVPCGVWHRGIVREPAVGLFITRGDGTEHRPV